MAATAEKVVDRAMGGEKTLRLAGGLETAHRPFLLSGGLVGNLSLVVQPLMLPMFAPRKHLGLRRSVALEFVGDQDARRVFQAFEQLPEKALGGQSATATLHQDIENMTVLIHGALQIAELAVHGQINLVEMPLVSSLGMAPA